MVAATSELASLLVRKVSEAIVYQQLGFMQFAKPRIDDSPTYRDCDTQTQFN